MAPGRGEDHLAHPGFPRRLEQVQRADDGAFGGDAITQAGRQGGQVDDDLRFPPADQFVEPFGPNIEVMELERAGREPAGGSEVRE